MPMTKAGWAGKQILVVDDQPLNRMLLADILQDDFRVVVAADGEEALKLVRSGQRPDLILLDRTMPGLDGLEVCRRFKNNSITRDVPVIFVTGLRAAEDEAAGFDAGAVDYISKPVTARLVLARVKAHLESKLARDLLRDQNQTLEWLVQRRVEELSILQDITIFSLASLAELRDTETGAHIRRTQTYVRVLAETARTCTGYATGLDDAMIDRLYRSAPLHDVGKVAISDQILFKPGPLTVEERKIIETHTVIGRNALLAAVQAYGTEPTGFLQTAIEIAYSHHERWDGGGYPERTSGEQIPLSARMMAIADVYDALVSRRVYKAAMPHPKAVEVIRREQGRHFDPELVDAFLRVEPLFNEINQRYADSPIQKTSPGLQRGAGI